MEMASHSDATRHGPSCTTPSLGICFSSCCTLRSDSGGCWKGGGSPCSPGPLVNHSKLAKPDLSVDSGWIDARYRVGGVVYLAKSNFSLDFVIRKRSNSLDGSTMGQIQSQNQQKMIRFKIPASQSTFYPRS